MTMRFELVIQLVGWALSPANTASEYPTFFAGLNGFFKYTVFCLFKPACPLAQPNAAAFWREKAQSRSEATIARRQSDAE
ncbi:MAG: hypothetical protein Q4D82_03115 [Neisseria sp.]|nr:hypothetical protein [Neisseria sp.]